MNIFKKLVSTIALLSILALPITPVLLSTGCTTTAQQSATLVEYQALSGVINLVDVLRGAYDTLYKAHKVSQATDDKVAKAYLEYQRVGNLAVNTAKAQAVAVANGTAPAIALDNPYIVDLQNLVNGLIDLFNTAQPPAAKMQSHIAIAKNPKA